MIKDAIWGKAAAQATPATASAPVSGPVSAAPSAAPIPTGLLKVDVTALLDEIQSHHDQQLNWRTSIVDLMKLIGLDSSLTNRKELAEELGYLGERDGSAEMNMWLHKRVMRKLAENGGTIPEELTH
ncbi:DUF3597 domain-containing protein [Sphingomonas sp.]|uniref:DUF3597 domain-containing protein n=1 Tax=Sphingomonas sp. TaxID=28214 RepID=UPI0035A8AAFE